MKIFNIIKKEIKNDWAAVDSLEDLGGFVNKYVATPIGFLVLAALALTAFFGFLRLLFC